MNISQFQFHSCPVVFPEGTNIQNDLLIKLGQLSWIIFQLMTKIVNSRYES